MMVKSASKWFVIPILIVLLTSGTACAGTGQLRPSPTADIPITDPGGSLVVLSHSGYQGIWYNYYIVGEIQNTSAEYMRFIKVAASLYDEAAQMIGSGSEYAYVDILPPGAKTSFKITLFDQATPAWYKLQIEGFPTETRPRPNIEITTHSLIPKTEGGYDIVGEIQNNSYTPVKYVKIVATLYDAEGRVVGADYTFAELNQILAGDTSPFAVMIFDDIDFDHYELIVSAR